MFFLLFRLSVSHNAHSFIKQVDHFHMEWPINMIYDSTLEVMNCDDFFVILLNHDSISSWPHSHTKHKKLCGWVLEQKGNSSQRPLSLCYGNPCVHQSQEISRYSPWCEMPRPPHPLQEGTFTSLTSPRTYTHSSAHGHTYASHRSVVNTQAAEECVLCYKGQTLYRQTRQEATVRLPTWILSMMPKVNAQRSKCGQLQ